MRLLILLCVFVLSVCWPVLAVSPDAAVLAAPQLDDLALLQMDAASSTTTSAVSALETALASTLSEQAALQAQVEAQQQTATNTEADSETESEAEADSVASLEGEFEAEAEAEIDAAEPDHHIHLETATEGGVEAEAEAEAAPVAAPAAAAAPSKEDAEKAAAELKQKLSGEVPTKKSIAIEEARRRAEKALKVAQELQKKHDSAKLAADKKIVWRRRIPTRELRIERKAPGGPAEVVHLPGGKKLFKSNIVHHNLRVVVPPPKPQRIHSKERALSAAEADRLAVRANQVETPRFSDVRRAFLNLNPEQKLRARFYSPSYALLKALNGGLFANLQFDPPTGAVSSNSVVQHLTVRHHAPSIRQRAEVSALRAATRTLRRISSKQAEYKLALNALQKARAEVQAQVHHHLVLRADEAKKVADRAARRAAWSGLLQHHQLRHDLLLHIGEELGKGQLTGAARTEAIKALLKRNLSPVERAKLHAFIKGHQETRRALARLPAAARAAAVAAHNKAEAKQTAAPAPAVSAKDQAAVDALVARIKAAVSTNGANSAAAIKQIAVNAQQGVAPAPAAAPAKTTTVTPITSAAVTPRFARVAATVGAHQMIASASQSAAEAAESALHELGVDVDEVDNGDELLMKTQAAVAAAQESTDDFLKAHNVAI